MGLITKLKQTLPQKIFPVVLYVILGLLPIAGYSAQSSLLLHFIDVGEGDAILVELPGRCNFLIDTGNLKTGIDAYKFMVHAGIHHINHLILTHPHLDHIGGVFAVARLLRVSHFYDNGEDLSVQSNTCDTYRWYRELVRNNTRYSILKKGETLCCPPLTIKVLWPPRPNYTGDWNTNSIVLRLSFGKFHCLLMGDANALTERRLLASRTNLRAQVLKSGHHGAKDATTQAFLSAVYPDTVIISVNKDNIRGYPAQVTLRRIKKAHARILRTDHNGTITIKAYADGSFKVLTELP